MSQEVHALEAHMTLFLYTRSHFAVVLWFGPKIYAVICGYFG